MSNLQDWFHKQLYRFTCSCLNANIEHSAECVASAVLCDETLYREATAAERATNDHEVDGPYVKVYPVLPSADDVFGILKEDQ